MSQRKIEDENLRTIQKSKRSYYITLPIRAVRRLGWKKGREVRVREEERTLVVEERRPRNR